MDNALLDLEGVQEPLAHKISHKRKFVLQLGRTFKLTGSIYDAAIFVPCVLYNIIARSNTDCELLWL